MTCRISNFALNRLFLQWRTFLRGFLVQVSANVRMHGNSRHLTLVKRRINMWQKLWYVPYHPHLSYLLHLSIPQSDGNVKPSVVFKAIESTDPYPKSIIVNSATQLVTGGSDTVRSRQL